MLLMNILVHVSVNVRGIKYNKSYLETREQTFYFDNYIGRRRYLSQRFQFASHYSAIVVSNNNNIVSNIS